jgi:hypothetical protein
MSTTGSGEASDRLDSSLEFAIDRVSDNLRTYRDSFPTSPEAGHRYEKGTVRNTWTAGFWPGMV